MGWNDNPVRVSKRIAKADLSKNSLDWQPSPIDRGIHNKYIDIQDLEEFILLITAEISAPSALACIPAEMLSAAEICIRSPALLPELTIQSKWSSHSAMQKNIPALVKEKVLYSPLRFSISQQYQVW